MDDSLLQANYKKACLYDMAEWYDTDYAGYLAENQFYEHTVKKCLSPEQTYLELGAGTGRLALRYAQQGTRVHAIEPASSMLERLRQKAASMDKRVRDLLTTELACAETFEGPSDQPVGLISFPFNGILHVHGHDHLRLALQRAKHRLDPGGYFALDITAPAWEDMGGYVREWGRLDERVHPTTGELFLTYDRCRYDEDTRLLHSDYRFIKANANHGVELDISQFMWTYQEILHSVEKSGFVIEEIFGDVDLTPWCERSTRLLLLARCSDCCS